MKDIGQAIMASSLLIIMMCVVISTPSFIISNLKDQRPYLCNSCSCLDDSLS